MRTSYLDSLQKADPFAPAFPLRRFYFKPGSFGASCLHNWHTAHAYMLSRIYHMNISEKGNVCIDILKNNWSPALSIFKVVLSLSSLLTDPNPCASLYPLAYSSLFTPHHFPADPLGMIRSPPIHTGIHRLLTCSPVYCNRVCSKTIYTRPDCASMDSAVRQTYTTTTVAAFHCDLKFTRLINGYLQSHICPHNP